MSETATARVSNRPDALVIYARRKARLVFLRRRVEEGHPVLSTEAKLIEMARSKLLEDLLSRYDEAGLDGARSSIVDQIRSAMHQSVSNLVSDAHSKDQLFADIELESLDDLFPTRSL